MLILLRIEDELKVYNYECHLHLFASVHELENSPNFKLAFEYALNEYSSFKLPFIIQHIEAIA